MPTSHHARVGVPVPPLGASSLVTLMFCGFTIGSALGGLIAAQVLDATAGGRCSSAAVCVPLAAGTGARGGRLPESVRYLVDDGPGRVANRRGAREDRAGRRAQRRRRSPARQRRRSRPCASSSPADSCGGTLLLWLAFFMSLLVVYLLSNWMPTLIQQAPAPRSAMRRSSRRCSRSAARSARLSSAG